MEAEHKVIAISIILGILSWIIDALLDAFFFYQGTVIELLATDIPPPIVGAFFFMGLLIATFKA